MPAASLSIPPSAEHVRTARLVVAAAARRAGLDEETVDDVRLAVGEATARAVLRHGAAGIDADVALVVTEEPDRFEVAVSERADAELPETDDGVALALVRALVPDVRLEAGLLVLGWPRPAPDASQPSA